MAKVRNIFCSKLECSLFNQIITFSGMGLSVSLALVFVYDLRIVDQWV
jgi:hypothetical protein